MRKSVGIVTIKVGDYDVLVDYEGHWENDGIGKYEFWGALCFDKGADYLVVDKIEPVYSDDLEEVWTSITIILRKNLEQYAEEISDLHGGQE